MIPLTLIKPSGLSKLVFHGPSSDGCHPSPRHAGSLVPGVILNAQLLEEWSLLEAFNAGINESSSAFMWAAR